VKTKNSLFLNPIALLALQGFLLFPSINSQAQQPVPVETANQDQTPQAPASANSKPIEFINECSGLPGKPFSTYSKFYFKADGKAYGLKRSQEVQLKMDSSLIVQNTDLSVNTVETIKNFKIRNGITEKNCPPTDSNQDANPRPPAASASAAHASESSGPATSSKSCHTRSEADSVVLAMSWQPAFCEEKQTKPECSLPEFVSEDSYHAKNFTLHGLWPNRNDCGQNYGFCGGAEQAKNFCKYPEVKLSDPLVASDLEVLMPSRKAGSCLERHEWQKHGTCQFLDESQYFGRATQLVKGFNNSHTADLVRLGIAQGKIKKNDLINALDEDFGSGASRSFIIVCKKNRLAEIQVTLKAETISLNMVDSEVSIANLIDSYSRGYVRGCRNEILIDRIGQSK
jgi:ribonuclease I